MQKTTQLFSKNTAIRIGFTGLCALSSFSHTALADSHRDYAKVTHVEPIYETISYRKPHRECRLEKRVTHHKKKRSATPTIVGALVGGAIGNKIGHNKSNKRVGAVAGAILGGSIAHDIQSNRHHKYHDRGRHVSTERVCHTTHTTRYEKKITSYDVAYKYRGRSYNTIMDSHPGKRIRVAIDISPINY